ncbi:MAG: hypothetical protein AAGC81_07375 [Pseudomonadota bacterium]
MTVKSTRNALLALCFCVVAVQGFALAQSVAVINATLSDGAPEPAGRHNLSKIDTFLSLFG